MKRIALALTLLPLAAAAETRCGWVDNPTPGNWWLTDRDGEWTLSLQGVMPTNNWDVVDIPAFTDWVRTNGSYGYGCGCFEGTVDWQTGWARWLSSVRALPLSRCREDRALPRR